jgi:hypothetical protein
MIEEPESWQASIAAIDDLIDLYKQHRHTNLAFYDGKIAEKTKKRRLAVRALRLSEKLRDVTDEYLKSEEEVRP